MIVVDSSALVAIAEAEPEAGLFAEILADTDIAWLSPTNYVETAMVLIGRGLIADRARLDRFWRTPTSRSDTTCRYPKARSKPSSATEKAATPPASTSATASPTPWPNASTPPCSTRATTSR